MNRLPEIELMRLLHGELPPERAFELHERLAREPELAAELRRLEATWDRLELPPASPVPRGFARAVTGRAESGGLWSLAPTRIRAAGFALLAAGLALGVGIASALARLDSGTPNPAGAVVAASPTVPTSPVAPGVTVPNPAAPVIPGSPTSPTAPAGAPAGSSNGATSIGPKATNSATPPPSDGGSSVTPPAGTGAAEQMADLDYDLPADDGSFADEGTLADDFWQAFDGTEGASGTGDGTGSGSEGL